MCFLQCFCVSYDPTLWRHKKSNWRNCNLTFRNFPPCDPPLRAGLYGHTVTSKKTAFFCFFRCDRCDITLNGHKMSQFWPFLFRKNKKNFFSQKQTWKKKFLATMFSRKKIFYTFSDFLNFFINSSPSFKFRSSKNPESSHWPPALKVFEIAQRKTRIQWVCEN